MSVVPIDNCESLKYGQGMFFEIGGPATSLLFLVRVKAVYNHSRIVTVVFSFLWLCITGACTILVIGINGSKYLVVCCAIISSEDYSAEHIPYTRLCTESSSKAVYATIPLMLTAVFDTLVFLAISYRMVAISMEGSTWSARAKSFFTGNGLYHLSKSLLQSGQAYYLSVSVLLSC